MSVYKATEGPGKVGFVPATYLERRASTAGPGPAGDQIPKAASLSPLKSLKLEQGLSSLMMQAAMSAIEQIDGVLEGKGEGRTCDDMCVLHQDIGRGG
jgi:hypothetical protein